MSTAQTSPSEVLRWTAKRKAAVVLELLQGKTTAAEVLTVPRYFAWVGLRPES